MLDEAMHLQVHQNHLTAQFRRLWICLPALICSHLCRPPRTDDPVLQQFWLCSSLVGVGMQGAAYWRLPFKPVLTSRQLTEYVVLDVEPTGTTTTKFVGADIQACTSPLPFIMHMDIEILNKTMIRAAGVLQRILPAGQRKVCSCLSWLWQSTTAGFP